jgi:methionine sulfoxide reductase heme-binding subunit
MTAADTRDPRLGRRPSRGLKPVVFTVACLPLAKIGVDLLRDGLGADPIAEILNRLGWWTLVSLCVVLSCTPLKLIFHLTWPMRVRRMLGLFAFFYGVLHFSTYLGLDQNFDFQAILKDIVKRKFITIGFLALMMLLPLALTSTDRMVRRLGYLRWKKLHRLVYVAAICGVIHFVWRVKADLRAPLTFAAIVALLLGIRVAKSVADALKARRARPGATAA